MKVNKAEFEKLRTQYQRVIEENDRLTDENSKLRAERDVLIPAAAQPVPIHDADKLLDENRRQREELEFLLALPVRNEDWEGYAVEVRSACRRALSLDSEKQL